MQCARFVFLLFSSDVSVNSVRMIGERTLFNYTNLKQL